MFHNNIPNLDTWLPEGLAGFQSSLEPPTRDYVYIIELKVKNVVSKIFDINILTNSGGIGSDASIGSASSYLTLRPIQDPQNNYPLAELEQRCQPIYGDTNLHSLNLWSNLNLRNYINDDNVHTIQWKFHYKLHSKFNDYSIDSAEVFLDGTQLSSETIYTEGSTITDSVVQLGQNPLASADLFGTTAVRFPLEFLGLYLTINQSDSFKTFSTDNIHSISFDDPTSYIDFTVGMGWVFRTSQGRLTIGNDVHLGTDLIQYIQGLYNGSATSYVLEQVGNSKLVLELNAYDYVTLLVYYQTKDGTWVQGGTTTNTITNRSSYTNLDHVYIGMSTYKTYAGVWFAMHYTSEASNAFLMQTYQLSFNEGYKALKSGDDFMSIMDGFKISYITE